MLKYIVEKGIQLPLDLPDPVCPALMCHGSTYKVHVQLYVFISLELVEVNTLTEDLVTYVSTNNWKTLDKTYLVKSKKKVTVSIK